MKTNTKRLIGAIAIPLVVGGISALLTKDNMLMFDVVKQPPLSPPMWLFPVVWTILYVLMGLASYYVLVSRAPLGKKRTALSFYAIQLAFNFVWSLIFFNKGDYLFAFIWLIALWLLVMVTTVMFFDVDRKSGILMIPYILWLSFAAYLNYGVYVRN